MSANYDQLAEPSCPPEVIDAALQAFAEEVHILDLLGNPSMTSAQIETLIRRYHEVCDMELLDSHLGMEILYGLALHPNLPHSIAREWAKTMPTPEYLAQNPMLPRDLLEQLAAEGDDYTRECALRSLTRLGTPVPM